MEDQRTQHVKRKDARLVGGENVRRIKSQRHENKMLLVWVEVFFALS